MVASTSSTTTSPRSVSATVEAGRPPGSSDQTWRRTRARALSTLPSRAAVNPARVRHTVGAEATGTQQRCLVTQHVDVGDRLTTIGEHDRHIGQHPAPVMERRERPPRQRHRQLAGQADPIGQKPQASTTGMSHHAGTTARYRQPSRPQSTVHLRSAFPLEKLETSQSQESPAGQALPCIYTPTNSINDERAGLKAAQRNQSRPPFH